MKVRVNDRITICIPSEMIHRLRISVSHMKGYTDDFHHFLFYENNESDYRTTYRFIVYCLNSNLITEEERKYLRKLQRKITNAKTLEEHYAEYLHYINNEDDHSLDYTEPFCWKILSDEKINDYWDFAKYILHLKKEDLF